MPQSVMETGEQGALERHLPDNCVEYFLFLLDTDDNALKQQLQLKDLQKTAQQLCQTLTTDYIWQRDGFELNLEVEKSV